MANHRTMTDNEGHTFCQQLQQQQHCRDQFVWQTDQKNETFPVVHLAKFVPWNIWSANVCYCYWPPIDPTTASTGQILLIFACNSQSAKTATHAAINLLHASNISRGKTATSGIWRGIVGEEQEQEQEVDVWRTKKWNRNGFCLQSIEIPFIPSLPSSSHRLTLDVTRHFNLLF